MRIILYTGKGGVGKTTVSAATAVLAAEKGYKTVVLSTDIAHSLSDSLGIKVGGRIKNIAPRLFALEVNIQQELKDKWGIIKDFLVGNLRKRGFNQIEAEEFAIFPGMEELFSLLKVMEFYESGEFDLVIVDCAPTGSTIRMLGFPDILRWHMEHLFSWERKIIPKLKPLIERMTKNAFVAPDARVYDSIEELYDKISQLKEILLDNTVSSMRLVLNPEKMVIAESQRAYTYLNLFGYSVDTVIANRVIPDSVTDPYFDKWKTAQRKYLKLARKCFAPLEMLSAELMDDEMVGLDCLKELGKRIFRDKDPISVLYEGRPMELEKVDQHYFLYIKLPFIDKSEVGVWIKGNELILEWGNFKSHTMLPGYLLDMNLEGAKYRDGRIKITFGPAGHSIVENED